MIDVSEMYRDLELIKFKKELYYHYLLNHCLSQKQDTRASLSCSRATQNYEDVVTNMKATP